MEVYVITHEWENKACGRENSVVKAFKDKKKSLEFFNQYINDIEKTFREKRGDTFCIGVDKTENAFIIDYNDYEEWEEVKIRVVEMED